MSKFLFLFFLLSSFGLQASKRSKPTEDLFEGRLLLMTEADLQRYVDSVVTQKVKSYLSSSAFAQHLEELSDYAVCRASGAFVDKALRGYVTKYELRQAKKSVKKNVDKRTGFLEKTVRCFILESQANFASFLFRQGPVSTEDFNMLQSKMNAFNREVHKKYNLGDVVFYDHEILKNERGEL